MYVCKPHLIMIPMLSRERKLLLEIGNRCENNVQFVAVEKIRRYASYSLTEYAVRTGSSL